MKRNSLSIPGIMIAALVLCACTQAAKVSIPEPTDIPPTATNTATPSPVPTATPIPTQTPMPTSTPTETPIPLGMAGYPVESNDQWEPVIEEINGVPMALVPAGCFEAGAGGSLCFDQPFWIDVYEVTIQLFGSSGCPDFPQGGSYPRTCVNWADANAYCGSRGVRLPAEWEWEYAARGPSGWTYPWGDTFDGQRVVYILNNCDGYYCPVGSNQAGVSWVGAFDMVGNAWEWTANDFGDAQKSIRGGSFNDSESVNLVPGLGNGFWTEMGAPSIGFRCALSYSP